MSDLAAALGAAVLATARAMNAAGINRGTAGNVSVRCDDGFIITPTGMAYDDCKAADMVKVGISGAPPKVGAGATAQPERANTGTATGKRKPSSEWRFHHDIYAARHEAGAIIHAHSPFATALACQQLEIPPFHYMIARFGGATVRCAAYATFGTQALSDAMLVALQDRCACLMAHHGMVVFGSDLKEALALAIEFESLCEQYWRVLQLGQPKLLSADEMTRVSEKFKDYGRQ
ncbi:MAG: class II aldolase/adducin family protein [Gammaproteobacteria bacterium]|nr:class II aldolase [Rhodocyclaceae bacterium]MBU3910405.1 class II aldolase/adducin family protein [Gammaproteobacteria bacterium]MBU3990727.1 class II aldolase/adducin family protein [Gammaproteobacteria bacterium]MBU4004886.1 class II aldolase/adducin family protein [Gammaproteobacteria bacterium]MBU4020479.1 class II aldolase/adducin family protein [Gammaproteobacteria bacterium]